MRRKGLLLALPVTLVALGAAAFSLLRRESRPKVVAAYPPAAALPVELSVSGRIQARHVIPVSAATAGTLDAVFVDVGQDVYEGQVLAHISSQSLDSAREEAERAAQSAQEKVSTIEGRLIAARLDASRSRADANRARDQLERAEKAYQRQQLLHREGATPRLVYEKSEREFETARAEFTSLDALARQAEEHVTETANELNAARRAAADRSAELETATTQAAGAEVRSPASGILVGRKADPGKLLTPEEANDLFEIAVDTAQLAVLLNPDDAAVKRIRAGQEALIFVAGSPGVIPGTVAEVAGGVSVTFTSPSPAIRPGMTAQVRLKLM
ncbi:MAG TPA: efflux RND transporter periplasmic adaptor subunit [Bryobacteraceae bacterium]|nr:efflux RND transporter periplasmic adaptor subunit [Bryobacteraceae bacterium]